MSELHPETMAEKIRSMGMACHCETCRGCDLDIDTLISVVFHQQKAEIVGLRVALARICCEANANPHNIADAALGHPTVHQKLQILKAAEAKEGKNDT